MATALHLLKSADAPLALATITGQLAAGDQVAVALLHGAPAPALPGGVRVHRVPDQLSYDQLLELIFASDSVIAW